MELQEIIKSNSGLPHDSEIELKESTKLIDDLGYDELSFVELVIDIELKYKISVNDSCVKTWLTVKDVFDTVGVEFDG